MPNVRHSKVVADIGIIFCFCFAFKIIDICLRLTNTVKNAGYSA